MKELKWKDEYLLGIPELDLQHKRIFDCFVTIAAEGLTRHDRWLADSSIGVSWREEVAPSPVRAWVCKPGMQTSGPVLNFCNARKEMPRYVC